MMKKIFWALWLGFLPAYAEQPSIINVRKNIPLSDDEPALRDFYIGHADQLGLKKNQILTVFRKHAALDSVGVQNYGEVEIPVGQIKVIMVAGKIAIAREHKLFSRDDLPMLEQRGLMIGDFVSTSDR